MEVDSPRSGPGFGSQACCAGGFDCICSCSLRSRRGPRSGSRAARGSGTRPGIDRGRIRQSRWTESRTAPDRPTEATRFFTVTHPFHPWCGRRLELIDCERRWGQWRVYYLSAEQVTMYLPAAWTDVGPKDPFVEQARGRAIARVADLLELAKLTTKGVKEITPIM